MCYLVLLLLLFAQAAAEVVVLVDVLAHVVHSVHQHLQAFLEMRAGAEGKAEHSDFIHTVRISQTTTNIYCRFTSEPTRTSLHFWKTWMSSLVRHTHICLARSCGWFLVEHRHMTNKKINK